MIPGMGSPKQMKRMMDQMGIKSEEIAAERVVIEKSDGKIIISEPQIVALEMQGQKSFQIVGKIQEVAGTSEDDVKLVMEQAGVGKEEAEKALKEADGDIAQAIMKLKEE